MSSPAQLAAGFILHAVSHRDRGIDYHEQYATSCWYIEDGNVILYEAGETTAYLLPVVFLDAGDHRRIEIAPAHIGACSI